MWLVNTPSKSSESIANGNTKFQNIYLISDLVNIRVAVQKTENKINFKIIQKLRMTKKFAN